jgi:3-oxoacyl-[acyl-carrier protein] reductase
MAALTGRPDGRVVLVLDSGLPTAAAVIQAFADAGDQVFAVPADATMSASDVHSLVGQTLDRWGRIDVLYEEHAPLPPRAPISATDPVRWDDAFSRFLLGPWAWVRAVAPAMARRGNGRIVQAVHASGRVARVGLAAPGSALAGLIMLTRVLALELAPLGVTANVLVRGETAGEVSQEDAEAALSGVLDEYRTPIPAGRLATPSDHAAAAIFLASPAAAHVTGQVLVVDGGQVTSQG